MGYRKNRILKCNDLMKVRSGQRLFQKKVCLSQVLKFSLLFHNYGIKTFLAEFLSSNVLPCTLMQGEKLHVLFKR